MTITAKNIGRINVWPTYAIAREADTEQCKFVGQLTVWQTNDEALANMSHEEGGGGDRPEWVPADAVIHIDLVGGDPQGRAWVEGTGVVAVDTLLGGDPNTEGWWAPTGYTSADLTVRGLEWDAAPPAFIGAARTLLIAGATITISLPKNNSNSMDPLIYMSADGNYAVGANGNASLDMHFSTNMGEIELLDVINVDVGYAANTLAATVTPVRLEMAMNGSTAVSMVMNPDDHWPTSGASPIVAAMMQAAVIQSITLYDPLPSTAGLSELSEVA
jgi:hypothetical protein